MRRLLSILGICAFAFVAAGCGDYSGGSSQQGSTGPVVVGGGAGGGLGASAQVSAFASTVYPIVSVRCNGCHAGFGPGTPHIAHPDPAVAWSAVVDNQKVNFSLPDSSRLVRRLATDFHYCWNNCIQDGAEMLAAVNAWDALLAAAGSTGGGGGVDVSSLSSAPLTLADGVIDEGDERAEAGIIALYEFTEGAGPTAFDTSNVAPPTDLSLTGDVQWLSNYGVQIATDGFVVADQASSRKLYDLIASPENGSGEYTIEAWVVPANTTQEGPARIVTYSRNGGSRNFTMAQTGYQYVFRNRSVAQEINNNGTPELITYDVDEDLQDTLQHVVYTYDRYNGRAVFVDGMWTDDVDEIPGARIWNWDDLARLGMGDEFNVNNPDRHWLGQIRFVAIFDRALSPAEIRQNFFAGVGKRLTMSFDISQWAGNGTVLDFSVQQFDQYSYLFCQPTFRGPNAAGISVKNVRIQVNTTVPVQGQAFTNLDELVLADGHQVSRQCSIIPIGISPAQDSFEIVFEELGRFQNPVVQNNPQPGIDPTINAAVPVLGIRDFERINETMSQITGVDPTTPSVATTFNSITQQLPNGYDVRAFVSSHQVGVAKLALDYCDEMVEDIGLRDAFFDQTPAFEWNSVPAVAFGDAVRIDLITDPILDKMLNVNVADQPDRATVEADLDQLIGELMLCSLSVCDAQRTKNMVKGACTSVLASAGVMIH